MTDTQFSDIEYAPVTLQTTDAAGQTSGAPTAPVTWVSSDEGIVIVVVSDDTLSANLVSTGPVGPATVTITDALGLSTTVNADVIASQPVALTAVVGDPQPK